MDVANRERCRKFPDKIGRKKLRKAIEVSLTTWQRALKLVGKLPMHVRRFADHLGRVMPIADPGGLDVNLHIGPPTRKREISRNIMMFRGVDQLDLAFFGIDPGTGSKKSNRLAAIVDTQRFAQIGFSFFLCPYCRHEPAGPFTLSRDAKPTTSGLVSKASTLPAT